MSHFTERDVERSFSDRILQRARTYVRKGHVVDAWWDDCRVLHGRVLGSEPTPYEVEIRFVVRPRSVKLDSYCDCPYSDDCKHAAAVALYALANELRTEVDVDDDEPDKKRSIYSPLNMPAPPLVDPVLPIPPDVHSWVRDVALTVADSDQVPEDAKQRVFFELKALTKLPDAAVPVVKAVNRTALKAGGYGKPTDVKMSSIQSTHPMHWSRLDSAILADLSVNTSHDGSMAEFRMDGRHGVRLLREVLSTGRASWEGSRALHLGPPRAGSLDWVEDAKRGVVTPLLRVEGNPTVLGFSVPWFVDLAIGECGPIDCSMPGAPVARILRRGPIAIEHLGYLQAEFERAGLPVDLLPRTSTEVVIRAPLPTPCLDVEFELCESSYGFGRAGKISVPVAFGKLTFEYEGIRGTVDGADIRRIADGQVLILRRNALAERYALEALFRCGWSPSTYVPWEIPKGRGNQLKIYPTDAARPLEAVDSVRVFDETYVPLLIEAGWRIEIDRQFRVVAENEVEWDIGTDSVEGTDWFEFRLGIRVEDRVISLRSILAQVFAEQQAREVMWAPAPGPETLVYNVGGCVVRLPAARLKAILQPLVELFGGPDTWPEELRLPRSRLTEARPLREQVEAASVPWKQPDELARLANQLATFDRLAPLAEPAGFAGELRGYQREGLAWLQFLREFGFGGILADDMGLGKTVQILAHIQTEKRAGRMDGPCLIVAPTSTLPNWRRECERFVPALRVLTLQGKDRASRYTELANCDIALTTYPLLARDKDLSATPYYLLVLDEAQNIKNAASVAAKRVRELTARHRVALSGTPVENHLGELWSIFTAVMPGFLGSDADFKQRFRNPIERSQSSVAREQLARRVRPYMLRRTKGQVARELPPKTEIVEIVEFEDAQRDLYESLRSAMDRQVRDLIAAQGLDRSHIQILDALLKLRQVCCDPRLARVPSARAVTESAKLDRLMDMLAVLREDGRRVLLFSQFTSMLDLVEERLRAAEFTWVRISGDTIDRETPVKRFQAGEVPLFLISLKAGGTGLNLTAADTVILYDPWWNPAVENQAIDRAHRIGQEKAVLVYKLVASGTIEEKILEMQARKGDLARSILTDDAEGLRTLTAADLRWVLGV